MFKKFKSLFVVEEAVPATKSQAVPKSESKSTPTKGNAIVKTTTVPTTVTNTNTDGVVSDKFLKILFDALEANNLEGFDYLEFKKSLQSLSSMPMDEATRYKSAFAMASSMNVNAKQLLDTANFYIGVLTKEEQKFEKALAQQKSTKVTAQEEQVKQLETAVKGKAEQIKKLTQEIEQIQQKVEKTNAEISKQTAKVSKTKNDFIASYNAVKGQIEGDITNMNKHLVAKVESPKAE
jgi:tetrahydromethanopterin S-methyltransferase subunit G